MAARTEAAQTYVVARTDERIEDDLVVIATREGVELVVTTDDYATMMINCANRYRLHLAEMRPEGMLLAVAGNDLPELFCGAA